MIATLSQKAIPIAIGAVAVVLVLGLWNMLRGGPSNRSQILMRWRIGLQFVAIAVIMTAIYFQQRG
ncbi:MAG: twin transmembrane helix small protein [Pseudomonadota bacterium]